ncbi:MAG: glycine cleavage system aminomethyltransferase GcvT, partial [Calditrichaeota bacterium]|nr:glycine cleavage system aminomethyltransferase GcvT [Calditrichota bacterium]
KDFDWMKKHLVSGVDIENVSDSISQLAVQGKNAETILQKLTKVKLADIPYYWFAEGELAGVKMIISRTGYTGEPGFELYIDRDKTVEVWDKIFATGAEFGIEPIGLGARDSLRLEKKMALYGNDIDQTTNPYEAGLGWITKVNKETDFIGKQAIVAAKEAGLKRKLVSLLFDDPKAFPRQHYKIQDNSGNEIGEISSGTISPILNMGIAMAYIKAEFAEIDSTVNVEIRNKLFTAKIIKGAFV